MISAQLSNFTKGWFVGDFAPTLCRTQAVEVAVKNSEQGKQRPRISIKSQRNIPW